MVAKRSSNGVLGLKPDKCQKTCTLGEQNQHILFSDMKIVGSSQQNRAAAEQEDMIRKLDVA